MLFCINLCSCSEKEPPSLNQEKLIEITSRPLGMVDRYKLYTLHICVYNDCTVELYANDFDYWYSDAACERTTVQITEAELEDIKRAIEENDALNLNENVGNRDLREGTIKSFVIYADDGEHRSGGLSPSNRSFLRVYDLVYNLVREESFVYTGSIERLQAEGYGRRFDRGPRLHDSKDTRIITTDMIQDFVIVPAEEIEVADATQTDAEVDELYGAAILLNEEGTAAIYDATGYVTDEPLIFFLYNNNTLYDIVKINNQIKDGTIYLNHIYNEADAVKVVDELEASLNLWREFKAEEEGMENSD
ncbi:MAG: hypothetical protein NC309_01560 [Ruminococcus sp.]|nr:hypothetical protein [Ruminococcus sp.]